MPHASEFFTYGRGLSVVVTIGATATKISDLILAAEPTADLTGAIGYLIRGKLDDGTDRCALLCGFKDDAMNMYYAEGVDDDTFVRGDRYVQRFEAPGSDAVILVGFG